jgi:hypothetical protein
MKENQKKGKNKKTVQEKEHKKKERINRLNEAYEWFKINNYLYKRYKPVYQFEEGMIEEKSKDIEVGPIMPPSNLPNIRQGDEDVTERFENQQGAFIPLEVEEEIEKNDIPIIMGAQVPIEYNLVDKKFKGK